ncbi:dehydrogenase/reductase SDR family member 4-like isoform X1 [Pleurodeles waltl]
MMCSWARVSRFLRVLVCRAPLCVAMQMSRTSATQRDGPHKDKVAIVTGSSQGIGLAIARRLAEDGAHVVVNSRKKVNVDRAVKELKAENLSVLGVVCNVGKEEDQQRLVTRALEWQGGIDYLISSVAVNPFVGNILDSTAEMWDKIFEVNVKSMFLMAKLSVPHMQKRGGGSIVFISSLTGYNPLPIIGPYAVSKTALFGLTKVLAPTLTPMNIRVNCLAVGLTRTNFGNVILKDEALTDFLMKANNVVRVGEPKDYGGVVSFLCSSDASYITGENIVAAGGAISRL